ncbi:hypothetical protein AB3X91_08650 [Paraburkholderia sp. BR14263]|uniref:hypothetical protein n=1 Tax=unclassified Paraburkholderia TaxID=2615204 RepID=UPI0034CD8D36
MALAADEVGLSPPPQAASINTPIAIAPAWRSSHQLRLNSTLGLLSGCIVIPLRMMTSHYAGAAFAGNNALKKAPKFKHNYLREAADI